VREGDHVMLVTDGGQLIRIEADQVRITGRGAGRPLMRTAKEERVTSCFPVDGRRGRERRDAAPRNGGAAEEIPDPNG
jgi:DNA gyrase/topoisomerase IV subunit A